MLNDRMRCNDPSPTSGMTVTLILKPASVRLHLVDFHRTLFYERLESYDLFVYTEVSQLVERNAAYFRADKSYPVFNYNKYRMTLESLPRHLQPISTKPTKSPPLLDQNAPLIIVLGSCVTNITFLKI